MELPAGLRWRDESETSASLRPPPSQGIAFLVAAVWNVGVATVAGSSTTKPAPAWFVAVGFVCGALFALCAVRAFLVRTRVHVERGELIVSKRLTPWFRFRAPLAEVKGFSVAPQDDGAFRVLAELHGSMKMLPFDVEVLPLGLHVNGKKQRLWPAPEAYAAFMAERLMEMVEAGRRAGHETYRT